MQPRRDRVESLKEGLIKSKENHMRNIPPLGNKKAICALAAALCITVSTSGLAMDETHKKYACTACHAEARKRIGPSYQDVADKYRADYTKDPKAVIAKLSGKVKAGGSGVWGPLPMAPHGHVPDANVQKMVKAVLDMPPRK